MSIIDAVGGTSLGTSGNSKVNRNPEASFLEFMAKSPAERLRDAMLKELGVTEEELASMSPEQRTAIEEKIKERLKQKMAVAMAEK